MARKILIFTLLFTLICSTIVVANSRTISTRGYSELEETPKLGVIKVEITGKGRDKANLEHQLREKLNKLQDKLVREEEVNRELIVESEVNFTHLEANKYQALVVLTIKFSEEVDTLDEVSFNVITIIEQAHSQSRVTYNQTYKFDYEIKEAYYTFKQPLDYQEQLFTEALDISRQKVRALVNINNFSSLEIMEIEEEQKEADIMTYQEKINLNQPQEPSSHSFSERLKVTYQIK